MPIKDSENCGGRKGLRPPTSAASQPTSPGGWSSHYPSPNLQGNKILFCTQIPRRNASVGSSGFSLMLQLQEGTLRIVNDSLLKQAMNLFKTFYS